MPPVTKRAMRRPLSSSGTGVRSSGMGLSLPLARLLDDFHQLARRAFDVVVHHEVVVAGRVRHLSFSDLETGVPITFRSTPPLFLSLGQLIPRRRHDEYAERVWDAALYLLGTLDLNLQNDIAALVAGA